MDSLDPRLLEILACPCPEHAAVEPSESGLTCTRCQTTFPVRDGIPAMLLDEAVPGPRGIGNAAAD